ncbi:MAG: alanine dehydrogenase [Leptospiraceae bacterium]|nr:MAG: alanine dehydrogenase [Leptospiraceae bacterium]
MIIGIPKEIKEYEYRIAITPAIVKELKDKGHIILIENNACEIPEYSNEKFKEAGAIIIDKAEEIWSKSDLILKVKEPQPQEYIYFRKNLILFTFLHLASNPVLTEELLRKEVIAIGYETIESENHDFPILSPMSEIAGKLAPQLASHYLLKYYGKKGILLSGTTGTEKGNIVIIGAGNVGINAAIIASGLGANVTLLDINLNKLKIAERILRNRIQTLYSNQENLIRSLNKADVIIGAIYQSGSKTPQIIKKDMLKFIPEGSLIFDVSIDQGGIAETSHPTTHQNPIFEIEGILHYAVPNIPSLVAKTSIPALANALYPYLLPLTQNSIEDLINKNHIILTGIQCFKGYLTHPAIAKTLNKIYKPLRELI